MKKIILTAAILLSCLTVKIASAQISLSINIGSQPDWGPTGYDHADYYYMPDIDSYYDINAHQYVYLNNNVWVHTVALPPRYSNYDVYHGYKVVVNQPNPWIHNDVIRQKYASYRGRRDQTIIRDSKEVKYRNHWNGNNNNRGQGRRVVVHKTKVVHKDNRDNHDNHNDHHDGHGEGHRN
ncbi:hypothetical protein [Mucilaginibacter aquaedulcis]|uniref:hypothetical protein n=1 Tax=Mucilaginibacter aquaedulcis TaxID=1187081 RepID=UPI0025B3D68F|nr:hypothetical protein [Mucilaginibacter aquaedulcis]MDN3550561.1 hypothetical protein [Mucilaginibacter aquaedulcis]